MNEETTLVSFESSKYDELTEKITRANSLLDCLLEDDHYDSLNRVTLGNVLYTLQNVMDDAIENMRCVQR